MLMHNVRIPKNNLFNKYVEVSKDGEFKKIGDPRVGFGAMMYAREMISCVCQKLYSLPIIIAVRYALFRKQFKSGLSDIAIIDYQTQQ
jgi:acyl-CoA oxidase